MTDKRREPNDMVEFDEVLEVALAESVAGVDAPDPGIRGALLERVQQPPAPAGFQFATAHDEEWLSHSVPGIRMKILALNKDRRYVTLLLDVAPGTRFPAHHHIGAEECYVVSGSLFTCGRRLDAGDFVHADPGTDHGELWTDEGCRVILVVPPEEHLPEHLLR
jgi:anti-sigma factor ChrR (cupin superfamily)